MTRKGKRALIDDDASPSIDDSSKGELPLLLIENGPLVRAAGSDSDLTSDAIAPDAMGIDRVRESEPPASQGRRRIDLGGGGGCDRRRLPFSIASGDDSLQRLFESRSRDGERHCGTYPSCASSKKESVNG